MPGRGIRTSSPAAADAPPAAMAPSTSRWPTRCCSVPRRDACRGRCALASREGPLHWPPGSARSRPSGARPGTSPTSATIGSTRSAKRWRTCPAPSSTTTGACLIYEQPADGLPLDGTRDAHERGRECSRMPVRSRTGFPTSPRCRPQPFDLTGFTDFETPCLEDAAEALIGDCDPGRLRDDHCTRTRLPDT